MKKVISIVGARPQFIKHAPMQLELMRCFESKTIHTGQHYDENMSQIFFEELQIPKPEYILNLDNSSLQGAQTAKMLVEIEKILIAEKPEFVVLYGDTNSTLSGALAASKLNIPLVHIEAGLRSYNKSMPEEVNRIIADHLSKYLFCPNENAKNNLIKEGIQEDNIYIVGDVMCDMLNLIKDKITPRVDYEYYFATIHRPYNTDDKSRMVQILESLEKLEHQIVFPIHPRTRNLLKSYHIELSQFKNINFIEPIGYLDSLSYQKFSNGVITDSGGMQKEAYMLRKKCITIRSETEWIETLIGGWNTLVFDDLGRISSILKTPSESYIENLYGDGFSSKSIVKILENNG